MQNKITTSHERQPQFPFSHCIQPEHKDLWVMIRPSTRSRWDFSSSCKLWTKKATNYLPLNTHTPKIQWWNGHILITKTLPFGKRKQTWVKAILKSCSADTMRAYHSGVWSRWRCSCTGPDSTLWENSFDYFIHGYCLYPLGASSLSNISFGHVWNGYLRVLPSYRLHSFYRLLPSETGWEPKGFLAT